MNIDYLNCAKEVLSSEANAIFKLQEALVNQDRELKRNFEEAVVEILKIKGKLIVSGVGKSGIAAQKIATSFTSVGLPSVFINSSEAMHGDLGLLQKKDVIILISMGGNSVEINNIISHAKNLKIKVIGIVSNRNSVLYQESDIKLLLPRLSEVVLKVPSVSFVMTTALADAILTCFVKEKNVLEEEYRLYHPGGKIGASLIPVEAIMRTQKQIPKTYKSDQMSKAIIEMTSKSLGCLVVVSKEDKVLGIITDGDLRRHMSQDLLKMKAENIMHSNPKTISPAHLVIDALDYMNKNKVTNLIVVKDSKLQGVIHIHDCLKIGLNAPEYP